LVNREKVVQDLQTLLKDYYWTDEFLIKAGKFKRPNASGTRRHKIPEDMKEIDALNRVYRHGHKKLGPLRKVVIKTYKSHMIFKKYYGISYLKYRFRQQRL